MRQWAYIWQIIYAPTIVCVKTALLLQYLRLFAPLKDLDRFMWYSARILLVANGIFYLCSTFITIFSCSPRQAFWNPLIKDFRCINNNIRISFTCSYNMVSDIVILILPSRAVCKLRIPTRKKVEIVLLFAVGLLYVEKPPDV